MPLDDSEEIPPASIDIVRIRRLRTTLLRWARESGRHFFWREPGVTPFQILVAEILLAKTQAHVAEPVATALLSRYQHPADLAAAKLRDLERLLYPLGLHRKRARHLKACARALRDEHEGKVPSAVDDLIKLPYVGRYAANAIACVAFEQPLAVLDANVSRIYQRVFSLPQPPPRLSSAHAHWAIAQTILPRRRAKAYNWAVLDLGGLICTAKQPSCDRCPVASVCDLAASNRMT